VTLPRNAVSNSAKFLAPVRAAFRWPELAASVRTGASYHTLFPFRWLGTVLGQVACWWLLRNQSSFWRERMQLVPVRLARETTRVRCSTNKPRLGDIPPSSITPESIRESARIKSRNRNSSTIESDISPMATHARHCYCDTVISCSECANGTCNEHADKIQCSVSCGRWFHPQCTRWKWAASKKAQACTLHYPGIS
jgi:hypothetical protein